MVYVMTGIRGDFEKYKLLKEKIKLKKEDDLYLLGNILCGKEGGIDILLDAMDAENIFPIAAQSELDCAKFLKVLRSSAKPDESLRKQMSEWFSKGGFALANSFMKLEDDDQKGYILEYISDEFTLVEEVVLGDKTFVLSAKGLGGFSQDKDVYDYSAKELTDGDFDPTYDEYEDDDKYIVCGDLYDFTPDEGYENRIVRIGSNIIMDHAENSLPCCLRLDDFEEFYV